MLADKEKERIKKICSAFLGGRGARDERQGGIFVSRVICPSAERIWKKHPQKMMR